MLTQDLFAATTADQNGSYQIALPDADLQYLESFVPTEVSDSWFEALMRRGAVRWRQDYINMYGRRLAIPRLNAWYGDPGLDYSYSGIPMKPEPWTELLSGIRARVQEQAGERFTSVLINLYRDGNDSVAWHADDEPELGPDPVIASLSLGATRQFQLRHRRYRENRQPVLKMDLVAGSLLIMRGATQLNWLHRVPKQPGHSLSGPRINLTFRRIAATSR